MSGTHPGTHPEPSGPERLEEALLRYLSIIGAAGTAAPEPLGGGAAPEPLGEGAARPPRRTLVSDVMTTKVVATAVDTPFAVIARTLAGARLDALPVVDGNQRVVGMVTTADLLAKAAAQGMPPRRLWPGPAGDRRIRRKAAAVVARDLMTRPAATTRADTPLVEAALLAARRRVRRLPVVGTGGRLVGIVSRGDLLRYFARSDEGLREEVVATVLRDRFGLGPVDVRVEVENGVVTLYGQVRRRSTAAGVMAAVRSVEGVVRAVDRIRFSVDDTGPAAVVGRRREP